MHLGLARVRVEVGLGRDAVQPGAVLGGGMLVHLAAGAPHQVVVTAGIAESSPRPTSPARSLGELLQALSTG